MMLQHKAKSTSHPTLHHVHGFDLLVLIVMGGKPHNCHSTPTPRDVYHGRTSSTLPEPSHEDVRYSRNPRFQICITWKPEV